MQDQILAQFKVIKIIFLDVIAKLDCFDGRILSLIKRLVDAEDQLDPVLLS